MKVCHLTTVHSCNDVRIFEKECVSLAKAGFDVTLLVVNQQSKNEKGVKVVNVDCAFTSRLSRLFKAANALYNKAIEVDADVYHFHDPELLTIALKLKRKNKIVIYDAHEDVPRQILGKYWIPKILRSSISYLFEKYENRIALRLDAIVAATPFISDRFSKVNTNSIDINNFPIVQEVLLANSTSVGNKVCYVGGISSYRGITNLVNAIDKTEDVKLILAGAFSPLEYEKELSQLSGWTKVENRGFVSRTGVYEIMNESFAGVVTLMPLPNYLDSLPIKMFEYMNAGIAVIASDFLLWKEIVEGNNCGICVDAQNPQAIADAIIHLKNNREQALLMGANGKKAIDSKYNWKVEENKLLNLYKQFKS